MEEFQVVNKKSRKQKRQAHKDISIKKILSNICFDLTPTTFFTDTIIMVKRSLNANKSSEVAESVAVGNAGAQPDVDIVCYGLGNFADSYIARYQLAFLMALREEFKVPCERCEIYDPQFTQEEICTLTELNFTVLHHNQEGKRSCVDEQLTVFYMPHCGKALYNNVVWCNWGPGLQKLVIIGNSFSRMIDSTPKRILCKTANYVQKIYPYTLEEQLPVPSQYEDVFNDTSIHTFISHSPKEVPKELWEDKNEPKYDGDDAEIIFR